jgi:hypothetical protein
MPFDGQPIRRLAAQLHREKAAQARRAADVFDSVMERYGNDDCWS